MADPYHAVYETATSRLDSVARLSQVAIPIPTGKASTITTFGDGTPDGNQPNFDIHDWDTALRRFVLRPAPPTSSDKTRADLLLSKTSLTWTTVDLADALKTLLSAMDRQGMF